MRRVTAHTAGQGSFGSQERLQPSNGISAFSPRRCGNWLRISMERTYHACLVKVHLVDKEKPLAIQSPSALRLAAVLRDVVWPADLALDRCP